MGCAGLGIVPQVCSNTMHVYGCGDFFSQDATGEACAVSGVLCAVVWYPNHLL